MPLITDVTAREILDSRGNPTVEAEVTLDTGIAARAAVPSGASTGEHEALELRDGDSARYGGKGVLTAVAKHRGVDRARDAPAWTPLIRSSIDRAMIELDGTAEQVQTRRQRDPRRLDGRRARRGGGARAAAVPIPRRSASARTLPVPMMNVLNGGAHADNTVDFQEFMIVPIGRRHFADALRMGAEVFHALKKVLSKRKLTTAVGDEGGFAPDLPATKRRSA